MGALSTHSAAVSVPTHRVEIAEAIVGEQIASSPVSIAGPSRSKVMPKALPDIGPESRRL